MLVQLPQATLDLELAPGNVGCALAQCPFQVLDLDEILRALALPLLGEPPCELEHLLPADVVLLRGRRVPADRLPGVLARFH